VFHSDVISEHLLPTPSVDICIHPLLRGGIVQVAYCSLDEHVQGQVKLLDNQQETNFHTAGTGMKDPEVPCVEVVTLAWMP
jgi:hypothetical protein